MRIDKFKMVDGFRTHMKRLYELVKYPTVIPLVLTVLCFCSMENMENRFSYLTRAVIVIICYICSMVAMQGFKEFILCVDTFGKRAGFCFIWLYGSFAYYGINIIEGQRADLMMYAGWFFIYAVWILPIMVTGYLLLSRMLHRISCREFKIEDRFSVKEKILMAFIIVFLSSILLYAFNPAITSPDSEYCYAGAYDILLGNTISDHHPFFYQYVLSLIMRINKSISFIVFIQILFYAFVIVKSTDILNRSGLPKDICLFFYVFFGLAYNSLILINTVWKDVPYTISLLWFSSLIGEYLLYREESLKIRWFIEFIISGVFVAYMRHGGIVLTAITVIALFVLTKEKKKIGISIIILSGLVAIIGGPLYHSLDINGGMANSYRYWSMAGDMLYVYYSPTGELNDDEMIIIEMAKEENDEYNPWWRPSDARGKMDTCETLPFLKAYLGVLARNPVLMTEAIMTRTNVIWTLSKPEGGIENCVARLTESHTAGDDISIKVPVRKNNFLTGILTSIIEKSSNIPLLHNFYWRLGIYTFAILSCFALIAGDFGIKSLKFLIPFIPILLNNVILIIACGWADYRYFWPNMVVSSFLIPYTLILLAKDNNNEVL